MFEPFKKNNNLLLLILLTGYILLLPLLEQSLLGQIALRLILTGLLVAAIFSMSYDFRYTALSVLFAIPCFLTQWTYVFIHHPLIKITGLTCMTVFIGYTCIVLLKQVLSVKHVTLNELYGAISGYILIGIFFACIYGLSEMLLPNAFFFSRGGGQGLMSTYVYFSFVVQATAGFGDITAISPFVRSFVTLEMILGVTYLAVLIGRLINAISGIHEQDPEPHSKMEEMIKEDIEAVENFLFKPFRQRPFGIMLSAMLFNFSASVLLIKWHLPFFLDSWGTSLAVLLGGFWIGIFTAILYHLLMAFTFWGTTSWFWLLNSVWIASATWLLERLGWISPRKLHKLLAAGIGIGAVNALLVQAVATVFRLKPDVNTLPVYDFFHKFIHSRITASLSETFCIEIADKTLSLLIATVVAFLICDILNRKKNRRPPVPR